MDETTQINNAVVLAAGLGTRMRPITATIPKPLVSVNGKAMLDHALDALARNGVSQAAINVHYLADQIELHVVRRQNPLCIISDERDELLDSGGGVKKAISGLSEGPFIILNADSFWIDGAQDNLAQMSRAWSPQDTDMLLLVCNKEDAVGFDGAGDFFMDEKGNLTRRGGADSAPFVYAGAIIAKAEKFHVVDANKFSLNQMFDEAISSKRLKGHVLDGLWLHVGTPEAITEAEFAIMRYQQQNA